MKKIRILNRHTPEIPAAPQTAQVGEWTRLVFILDRSGSMHGREEDTIGGYNRLLDEQRKLPGAAKVTTVLFDDRYERICDDLPLESTPSLTASTYFVRGSTALLDAIGRTITDLQARDRAGDRPTRTVVAITTDGLENASREYRFETIREMIHAQEAAGWEFLFLGANIDAAAEAKRIGIRADRAANFTADAEGIACSYEAVSCAMADVRANRSVGRAWKARLEK